MKRQWMVGVALVCGILSFVPFVHAQQASFGRGQGQQTVKLEWAEGSNPGGTGHRNGTLSTERPAGVTRPPAGEGLLWGELSLGPSGSRHTFAVKAPGGAGGSAVFMVDRNGDGDFTNDRPAQYEGKGTNRAGAEVAFDVPSGPTGSRPYMLYLWLVAGSRPGLAPSAFAAYAVIHRRGNLSIRAGQRAFTLPVYAGDKHTDASFQADSVMVDFNQDGRSQAVDLMKAGEARYFHGALITFERYNPASGTAVFNISLASSPGGATDVEAYLEAEPAVGKKPPPLGAPDLDGRIVTLEEYRGRVVLVDFWASWCGPCLSAMPGVRAVYDKYHDHGFDIVGVSLDKDLSALRAYLKQERIRWRQTCDGKVWKGELAQRWHVQGIPAPFLIGRDGKIVSLSASGTALEPLVKQELSRAGAMPGKR